jgi:glycosyltransferase involved in cell wall biosynthesis
MLRVRPSRSPPPANGGHRVLSIVVPAYNEANTLDRVLRRVLSVALPCDFEVIVVDDGSRDDTYAIAARIAEAEPRVRAVRLEPNGGKGSAIRHGASLARGDVLVVQDADLEVDPLELPRLLAPIAAGRADVVYGSRFLGQPFEWSAGYLGNWALTRLTNVLFLARLTDMETAHKMMRIDVFRGLRLEGQRFEIEPELTAKLLRCGHAILEVPIGYARRSRKEGKKIGWRDGVAAIRTLVRCRFLPMTAIRRELDREPAPHR